MKRSLPLAGLIAQAFEPGDPNPRPGGRIEPMSDRDCELRRVQRSVEMLTNALGQRDRARMEADRLRAELDQAHRDYETITYVTDQQIDEARSEADRLRAELDETREDGGWAEHYFMAERERADRLAARLHEVQCVAADPPPYDNGGGLVAAEIDPAGRQAYRACDGPVFVSADWLTAAQWETGEGR